MDDEFKKLFNSIDKLNPNATTLDDTSIADVKDYLDTGFYALNAIISADLYKGIAFNRITTLFGPSQSGKSLISARLQKSAQDKGMSVIIFDSEFDKDGRMEKSFGVDVSKVKTIPVETVEEVIVQASAILNNIIENKLFGKVLLILDSLGALSTRKEIEDATHGKVAQDMGLKAKLVKSFYRTMKGKCALSKCPFLVINHEIENPNKMYESAFKEQGGGKSIEFFSTTMLYVGKRKEKQDTTNTFDEGTALAKKVTGQTMRFFTQKNRLAIPHKEVECYLNYVKGIDPYSGLKSLLDQIPDLIYTKTKDGEKGKGYNWYLQTEKEEIMLGKYAEWQHDKQKWDDYILPALNKYVNREFAFRIHNEVTNQ